MCQRGFSRQPVWIHLAGGSRSIARVHACSDIGRAGFSRKSRSWKERLRERTVRGARHSGCICIRRAWNVDVRTREGRKCRSIFSNGVIFAVLNIHKTMICALLSLRCSHFPVRFIFSFACFFSSFFFFFFFFTRTPLQYSFDSRSILLSQHLVQRSGWIICPWFSTRSMSLLCITISGS